MVYLYTYLYTYYYGYINFKVNLYNNIIKFILERITNWMIHIKYRNVGYFNRNKCYL